ncbi:hypothetical protein SETIT_1G108800v2 [Setaria italica]|uniref:DUF4283 domain-containing protein n=1 Tax=Setaria italica TaxID=4555 RepID=A0A368PK21_SETIT|nr:hypothetical protein SETIT_1G108800v2 [Setaria italica]
MGSATFILWFGSSELRNSVLAMRTLLSGNTGIRLMPWNRCARATAGSLRYRARICLEGVPSHACHPETVKQLLNPPSFIDEIDYEVVREVEMCCFNLWVWMSDPNGLAKQATLKIEEPYIRVGPSGLPILRNEAARTLDYGVFLHLGRVLDYAPLPNSPSHASYESNISGIPDEETEEEWPVRHYFASVPGVPDVAGIVHRREVVEQEVTVAVREAAVLEVQGDAHSSRDHRQRGGRSHAVRVVVANGTVVAGVTPARRSYCKMCRCPHGLLCRIAQMEQC